MSKYNTNICKGTFNPSVVLSKVHQPQMNITEANLYNAGEDDSGLHIPPPFIATDQELISAALHLHNRRKGEVLQVIGTELDYDTGKFVPEGSKDLPGLMDWIALWFAHGDDDVVASSMSCENDVLSIHIALSKGSADSTNMSASAAFKSMLKSILDGDTTTQAFQINVSGALGAISKTCWGKLSSRVRKLYELVKGTQTGSTTSLGALREILKSWSGHQGSTKEENTTLNVLAKILKLGGEIVNGTNTVPAEHLDALQELFRTCEIASEFAYVKEVDRYESVWRSSLQKPDQALLAEFSYAIQRVAEYLIGAKKFVTWGVPQLFKPVFRPGNVTRDVNTHLKFDWVSDTANQPLKPAHPTWRMNSGDWFVNVVRSNPENYTIANNKEEARDAKIRATAKDIWKEGDVMATKVHVEIQMVYYLQKRNIKAMHKIIGVSAPVCRSCEVYFQGIRNVVRRKNQWAIRKSAGRNVLDWLCPPIGNNHPVGSQLWASIAVDIVSQGVGGDITGYLYGILEEVAAAK